jgi:hypothetical protein|tara:strand:+ start:4635 stop:5015 length:381 start_codon:yes stop_codon:yes gene_type:complete
MDEKIDEEAEAVHAKVVEIIHEGLTTLFNDHFDGAMSPSQRAAVFFGLAGDFVTAIAQHEKIKYDPFEVANLLVQLAVHMVVSHAKEEVTHDELRAEISRLSIVLMSSSEQYLSARPGPADSPTVH